MTNDLALPIVSPIAPAYPLAQPQAAPQAPAGGQDFGKLLDAEVNRAAARTTTLAASPTLANVMAPYAAAGNAQIASGGPEAMAASAPQVIDPQSVPEAAPQAAPAAAQAPVPAPIQAAPTLPAPAIAPVAAPAAPAAGTYVVRQGDSLSQIARHLGGHHHNWHQLYAMNRDTVGGNPNVIKPGQVLKVPTEWQPQTAAAPVHTPKIEISVAPARPAPVAAVPAPAAPAPVAANVEAPGPHRRSPRSAPYRGRWRGHAPVAPSAFRRARGGGGDREHLGGRPQAGLAVRGAPGGLGGLPEQRLGLAGRAQARAQGLARLRPLPQDGGRLRGRAERRGGRWPARAAHGPGQRAARRGSRSDPRWRCGHGCPGHVRAFAVGRTDGLRAASRTGRAGACRRRASPRALGGRGAARAGRRHGRPAGRVLLELLAPRGWSSTASALHPL